MDKVLIEENGVYMLPPRSLVATSNRFYAITFPDYGWINSDIDRKVDILTNGEKTVEVRYDVWNFIVDGQLISVLY